MTSRPPAGIQRQPQRSLSGTGILQRPTPQRTLSQQYSSSAPTRKSDNLVDLTADGSQLGRFGSSRPGGSRLKLELSQATKDVSFVMDSPKATEIESSLLSHRGRPKLQFEGDRPQLQGVHDLSTLSSIRGVENITPQTPMPLPTRPAHGVPSVVRGQLVAPTPSAKKDARPKPYVLEVPSVAPQYSSSGKSHVQSHEPRNGLI
jgi:mediator of RNA polymerase II transcription subunit 12